MPWGEHDDAHTERMIDRWGGWRWARGKKTGNWEAGVSLSSGFLLRRSHRGQDGMRWWINSTKKRITRPTIAGTQEVTISPQTASPQVSPSLARPERQVTPHAALQHLHAHEHTRQQGQAEFVSLVTRELITVCCPWYRFSNPIELSCLNFRNCWGGHSLRGLAFYLMAQTPSFLSCLDRMSPHSTSAARTVPQISEIWLPDAPQM